jgi:holo-[acyl-carrier protein] synthase
VSSPPSAPRPPDPLAAEGVVASAVEVVEIAEAARLIARADGGAAVFTPGELAYARARSDPARRLAARLAAKRAAARLLGAPVDESELEVVRGEYGPPSLRLSPRAAQRLAALGAGRALVSLTHERGHAAALVVLVERP